jgi:hypothetical protein
MKLEYLKWIALVLLGADIVLLVINMVIIIMVFSGLVT